LNPAGRCAVPSKGESARVHIGLERIVLCLVDVHAAKVPIQEIRQADGVTALDVGRLRRLHVGRNPILFRDGAP